MKAREADLKTLLSNLSSYSYTKEEDGVTNTYNFSFFDSSNANQLNIIDMWADEKFGGLVAGSLLKKYKDEDITASDLAAVIKLQQGMRWKHWIDIWEADYNPLWNVDGTEVRTTETTFNSQEKTEFGKSIEHSGDRKTTTTQVTSGSERDILPQVIQTTQNNPGDGSGFSDYNKITTSAQQIDKTFDSGVVTAQQGGSNTDEESGDETLKHTGKDTVEDTYVRHGNIGVTMSGQLIKDSASVWEAFDFYDKWLRSIFEMLTIPIYE